MTREKALSMTAEDVTPANLLSIALALGKEWRQQDAALYGVRRLLAVEKDKSRRAEGEKAERFYRGDARALPVALRKVTEAALVKVDTAREGEKAEESTPARKPGKAPSAPAKPRKAAPAHKEAGKAPKAAKGPTVRKAAKPAADAGGADIAV